MIGPSGTGGTWVPHGVGNAWVPGLGEVSVLVGPGIAYAPDQIRIFNFLIDCARITVQVLRHVRHAILVITPHRPHGGGAGQVEIPMVVTADTYMTYNGPLDPGREEESKSIGALVSLEDLQALAQGSSRLSFFVKIEMKDGSMRWINENGEAYRDFEICDESGVLSSCRA